MEWVGSWLLGLLEIAAWMFLGFVALIALFWSAMMALWAGIWLKNRIRGRKDLPGDQNPPNLDNWRH